MDLLKQIHGFSRVKYPIYQLHHLACKNPDFTVKKARS